MARRSASGGGAVLIVIAILIGAIANYWKELLAIGGVVLAAWILYKVVQSTKGQSTSSVSPSAVLPRPAVPTFVAAAPRDTGRVTSRNGDEYWVPPSRLAVVRGRSVGGGLYVGTGLGAVAASGPEPALLDEKLPVDRSPGDFSLRQLGYWPSYQDASSTARAAYLDWLATGRNRPDADLGYVFLYFYGLERRALYDARTSAAAKADLPWIEAELERLLGIYGRSGSFQTYAGSLLDLLRHQVVNPRLYDAAPPPVERYRGLHFAHRIALVSAPIRF
jgi:TerB-like protein